MQIPSIFVLRCSVAFSGQRKIVFFSDHHAARFVGEFIAGRYPFGYARRGLCRDSPVQSCEKEKKTDRKGLCGSDIYVRFP